MVSQKTNRTVGLDIVRCAAILLVIMGHFFLHSGFRQIPYHGWQMFLLGMVQTLIIINVPLFLILTGYLNLNKRVSRSFYLGGIRVLISYVLISVIIIAFRKYYLHEDLSWIRWLLKITDFTAIPYAWYIEMWIGLFLLTPFLNALWHSNENRRFREILVFSLFVLTALPNMFNRYGGVRLFPGYWEAVFPVCFFYIGAYIRTYKPRIPVFWLLASILALCLINPSINAVVIHDRPMVRFIGDGYGVVGVPLAALVFTGCYNIEISTRP